LKNLGYATGQFGKNHLGDRNEFLPTVHGFDEFFGNLYHLNAEEEPENPDYPKNPAFRQRFGPRGVMHTWAIDTDDPTVDPQYGKVGKQRIENTGPLTVERMKTIDDEFTNAAQAVLLLLQLDPHARLYTSEEGERRQDGVGDLSRRHGRA
jgi:arylsulfatase A-like enzyme